MDNYEMQMTNKAIKYQDMKREIERIKTNMDITLSEMQVLMVEVGASSFECLVDATTTLVVERKLQRKKQCNKEEMASDLGVEKVSMLKTPFLLLCAQQGKLTPAQYEKYFYHENWPTIKVKKRKPKKERKQRGNK
jgi:hypothetical protein